MMTKCKACSEVISDAATTCPKCGHPMKRQKPQKGFFDGCGTVIIIVLLILIVIALFGSGVIVTI